MENLLTSLTQGDNADRPLRVTGKMILPLVAHPMYRKLSDAELLTLLVERVPGIKSRKTGAFVLPVTEVVNGTSKLNRQMVVAILMGTKELL